MMAMVWRRASVGKLVAVVVVVDGCQGSLDGILGRGGCLYRKVLWDRPTARRLQQCFERGGVVVVVVNEGRHGWNE